MATKDTDPVVPSTQPRTSQGEAASGLPEAVVFPWAAMEQTMPPDVPADELDEEG